MTHSKKTKCEQIDHIGCSPGCFENFSLFGDPGPASVAGAMALAEPYKKPTERSFVDALIQDPF